MKVRSSTRIVRQKVIRVEFNFTRDELVALLASLERDINTASHVLPRELKHHFAHALKCADAEQASKNVVVALNGTGP
jgi:hydrogenase maturation factor HypF (carbamoyltransferase family)